MRYCFRSSADNVVLHFPESLTSPFVAGHVCVRHAARDPQQLVLGVHCTDGADCEAGPESGQEHRPRGERGSCRVDVLHPVRFKTIGSHFVDCFNLFTALFVISAIRSQMLRAC